MQSNKVIGIISYLPDNDSVRTVRISKLRELIFKCNSILNLPIYVVIQNYREEDKCLTNLHNVTISENYSKLGITGARRKLREWFLNSKYDYLIMLDDDCKLYGDRQSGLDYIKQIDEHPNKFYEFNSTLLKLFAISKELFRLEDYEDINAESGEGFEDRVFVNKLRKRYPESQYTFKKSALREESVSTKDKYSTWYTNQDIKEMLNNTFNCIEKL